MDIRLYQLALTNSAALAQTPQREITDTIEGMQGVLDELQVNCQDYRPSQLFIPELVAKLTLLHRGVAMLAGLCGYSTEELASLDYTELSEKYPQRFPAFLNV